MIYSDESDANDSGRSDINDWGKEGESEDQIVDDRLFLKPTLLQT